MNDEVDKGCSKGAESPGDASHIMTGGLRGGDDSYGHNHEIHMACGKCSSESQKRKTTASAMIRVTELPSKANALH